MLSGRERRYLDNPGLDTEADLFREFNGRHPFYRHIAGRCVKHAQMIKGSFDLGNVTDLLGRSGYCTRAALPAADFVTIVEHRPSFLDYLKNEFAPEKNVAIIDSDFLTSDPDIHADTVFCCEQFSFLLNNYRNHIGKVRYANNLTAFVGTLGPSNHTFRSFKVADHRTGTVHSGEVISELSHPVTQAIHAEVVRLAKERHGYQQDFAWPHAAPVDQAMIRNANAEVGFKNFAVIEEKFAFPGHQIIVNQQNARTFYMRFDPLNSLPTFDQIALLRDSIENVLTLPEYDTWCKIDAEHPVAYYLAW